jgi:phosphatidyl-myo-inositol dimannoside synthase
MSATTRPNRPLRSIWVTNDFPPSVGGAQSYYWGAIRLLDPADVVIVAPAHPDAAAFDATHSYRVVRAPTSVLWPTPDLQRTVERLVASHDADIVQLGHPLPAGLIGPRVKSRLGTPYVVFLGAAEVTIPAAVPGVGGLLRHVLRGASTLFTISEYTARAASAQVESTVPAEVLRAPLAVDDFVPAGQAELGALRRMLGIDGELVVCVGRLVPRKGQDLLIDAIALLQKEFPGLRLALVGGGSIAARLRRRAARRNVADRVLLAGEVDDTTMRTWLQAADLFASPCRTRWAGLEVEGYGLVFAEAALCGLPVIVGLSGGAPEAVIHGRTGLLVSGTSVPEVADAIRCLLRLPQDERRAMGGRGRDLALSRHAPTAVGVRYTELLWRAAGY